MLFPHPLGMRKTVTWQALQRKYGNFEEKYSEEKSQMYSSIIYFKNTFRSRLIHELKRLLFRYFIQSFTLFLLQDGIKKISAICILRFSIH